MRSMRKNMSDYKNNVELSDNDLMLLRELLMDKIKFGGKLCEIKRCIHLFEYFKEFVPEENRVYE